MTDKFNYSIVQKDDGNFSIRSSVRSYDIDHISDKDIISFYKSFSSFASFDTGLLPLDGTGVLAIRSAGPHTQIVAQHAPGLYHVNWGDHEGDSKARTYYVAQPYRIVIGDFEHGNLLGARMFYSPYPITSPSNVLYHVNLPNINCRGYRKNGVGWICLYHKEDWSSLPFNEKVSRFIERCSGVETYNDANMSETDGPRFYASMNKPAHLCDPAKWESYSSENGHLWTLDPDLWIPVLVNGLDDQEAHHLNGTPLTLAMAMLGNYRAYYTDSSVPKFYNIVSRSDLNFNSSQIADMIKRAFASAPVENNFNKKDDPYSFTVESRQTQGAEKLNPSLFSNHDEDEDDCMCDVCEEDFNSDDLTSTSDGSVVCSNCLSSTYCYIDSVDGWFHVENDSIFWSEDQDQYFHDAYDSVFLCSKCCDASGVSGNAPNSLELLNAYIYHASEDMGLLCKSCFYDYVEDTSNLVHCKFCNKMLIDSSENGYKHSFPETIDDGSGKLSTSKSYICYTCSPKFVYCPCGLIKQKEDVSSVCEPTLIDEDNQAYVSKCCASCIGNIHSDNEGNLVADYVPFSDQVTKLMIPTKNYNLSNYITYDDFLNKLTFD